MSSNGVPILVDSVMLEFVDSSNQELLKSDLLELMIGVYHASDGKETQMDCVEAFREWLHKVHGKIVSLSQAYGIYAKTWSKYNEFKKKLDDDLILQDSSQSRSQALTIE